MKIAPRILDIINEGQAESWATKLNPLIKSMDDVPERMELIKRAKKKFLKECKWGVREHDDREDIIEWYLRYVLFNIWYNLSRNRNLPNCRHEFDIWLEDMQDNYNFPRRGEGRMWDYITEHVTEDGDLRGVIDHFQKMPIPEIHKTVFTNQGLDLLLHFNSLVQKWSKERKDLMFPEEEDKRYRSEDFMDFPDGFKWVLKHTEICSLEGAALNHCGNNGPTRREGDELLSLRQPDPDYNPERAGERAGGWKPALTGVLNDHKFRGLVGHTNHPPSRQQLKYVIPLLKDNRIVQTDSWYGMTPEQQEEVLEANPNLKMVPEARLQLESYLLKALRK